MNEWQLDYSLVGRLCREKRNWSLLRGRIEISQMNFRKKMCFVSLPDALCHFIAYFRGTWEDDGCMYISCLASLAFVPCHHFEQNKTSQERKVGNKWKVLGMGCTQVNQIRYRLVTRVVSKKSCTRDDMQP